MNRVRVTYHGTVQGVGFRWACRAAAEPHPVTGWVRNEPDGSVMLEAQGEQPAIDALLADIDDQMAGNIRSKETEPIAIQPAETSFRIAR